MTAIAELRKISKVYRKGPQAITIFKDLDMEIEEGAWFAFANEDMTGGKVLVVLPEYQVPGLDQLMATIDRQGLTSSSGTKRLFYRLRYRDAFDVGLQAVSAQEGTPTAKLVPDDQDNAWFVEDAPSSRSAPSPRRRRSTPSPPPPPSSSTPARALSTFPTTGSRRPDTTAPISTTSPRRTSTTW